MLGAGEAWVGGKGSYLFYGCCEAFYKEDMGPEELFETVSNCFLRNVDRDSLSGWRAYIEILTPDKLIDRALKTRQDR